MDLKTSRERYLESRVIGAKRALAEHRGSRLLRCPSCNRASQLRAWTLQEETFYVRPHGCSGGDYWTTSDPSRYELTCPKCREMSEFNEYSNEVGYALVCEYVDAFKWAGMVQRGSRS